MSTSQTSNREQSASREALINESIERILAQPLVHPPFDLSEACFHGQLDAANGNKAGRVKVRILRALRSKSGSGSDQILVEGVVTATYKLDCPPSQYPKDNPEGWDVIAYGETKTEVPVLDATGEPMYETDANGIEIVNPDGSKNPKTVLRYPLLGYRDVTGYRFVYAGTLAPGVAGEMCINNLRLLGWKPGRVKAPLTAMATSDFVPAEDAEWVSAEDLGMTGEFTAGFTLKPADGNFPAKVQLSFFKLSDVHVTRQEAAVLDAQDWMQSLLAASVHGKVDSRKGTRAGASRVAGQVAPAAAATPAVSAQQLCGKPCGEHKEGCTAPVGHSGACKPPPF